MSTWIYRKPEDPTLRALCVKCNKNLQKKHSSGRYQALCSSCDKKRFMPGYKSIKKYKSKPKGYRKYKTMICERCKFEALDRCQLDVHHKDGNHHNNDPNNLETLCANCHRLEHFANKDQPLPRDELREGAFFLVPGLFTWLLPGNYNTPVGLTPTSGLRLRGGTVRLS